MTKLLPQTSLGMDHLLFIKETNNGVDDGDEDTFGGDLKNCPPIFLHIDPILSLSLY
jgi:hypothetical protein